MAHEQGLAGAQSRRAAPRARACRSRSPRRSSMPHRHAQRRGHDLRGLQGAHLGAADDDVRPDAVLAQEAAQPLGTAGGPCRSAGRRASSPCHSKASPACAWRSRCRRTVAGPSVKSIAAHVRKGGTSMDRLRPAVARPRAPVPSGGARGSGQRRRPSAALHVQEQVDALADRREDAPEGLQAAPRQSLPLRWGRRSPSAGVRPSPGKTGQCCRAESHTVMTYVERLVVELRHGLRAQPSRGQAGLLQDPERERPGCPGWLGPGRRDLDRRRRPSCAAAPPP